MKKLLLLFCFAISSQFIMAQCTPDGTATTWGLHPVPSLDLNGIAAVPETPACIGEPYSYTFTLVVPSSFSLPVGDLGVNYATIVSVDGLPSGLSFGDCNPATNCQIPGGTTGCFNIVGTPDATNSPGSFEITVNVSVNGSVGPIAQDVDLSFPPLSATAFNPFGFPLDPYAIDLRAATQCTNSNSNLLENELSLGDNKPNPFSDITTIEVEANKSDDYIFTVTNLLGEKVFKKEYVLNAGDNLIEFDGSELSHGIYIYSLSNELGVVSKKMIVGK